MRVRREWHSTVELANAYLTRGLSFPYGSFVPVDFAGEAQAAELVCDFKVTPATAIALSRHDLATQCKALLTRERRAIIVGRSGDGKSTLAMGVAGLLQEEGWRVFRYRPPSSDSRGAVKEILTLIGLLVRDTVLVLDDVNSWASLKDLEDMLAGAGGRVAVIATWTQQEISDDSRVKISQPHWVPLSWERIAPAAMAFLRSHEGEVVLALQALGLDHELRRVGLGSLDNSLEERLRRYVEHAKTVSEFLFLLRGGADLVAKEFDDLVRRDRSDIPVIYACIEQIADFERHVSPEETAAACVDFSTHSSLPPMTAAWVREVFEAQCVHRRMQKSRNAYSTVHRDWAKRLICAALANARSRATSEQLLRRDFDLQTTRPRRLLLLWSWIYNDPHGTPFIRDWAIRQNADDWAVLVETAANRGLEDLGLIANQVHLFSHGPDWTKAIGQAFAKNAELIANAVAKATATDWPALWRLFMAMEYACPEVVSTVVERWPPAMASAALSAANPDYYHSAWWFFAGVEKYSRSWCDEVGRGLDWEEISRNLSQVRKGDINTVEECYSLLTKLHVPILRSMIHRYANVIRDILQDASLHEIDVGFGGELSFLLQLFPVEVEAMADAIDPGRLRGVNRYKETI